MPKIATCITRCSFGSCYIYWQHMGNKIKAFFICKKYNFIYSVTVDNNTKTTNEWQFGNLPRFVSMTLPDNLWNEFQICKNVKFAKMEWHLRFCEKLCATLCTCIKNRLLNKIKQISENHFKSANWVILTVQ